MLNRSLVRLALGPLTLGVALFAGCNPPVEQGEAFIQGVIGVTAPDCVANPQSNTFKGGALLDIGIDAGTANNLILPLEVLTNLPSTFSSQTLSEDKTKSPNFPNYGTTDPNVITFTSSEVFVTTDEDRGNQLQLGQVDGTPVNDASKRITSTSGVVFNEQTQLLSAAAMFATAITKGDAALLQNEPFVSGAIGAGGLAHIIVNLRVVGKTTGSASVVTPPFPFPVDLCEGCLTAVPDCGIDVGDPANPNDDKPIAPIADPRGCFVGNDFPTLTCPG